MPSKHSLVTTTNAMYVVYLYVAFRTLCYTDIFNTKLYWYIQLVDILIYSIRCYTDKNLRKSVLHLYTIILCFFSIHSFFCFWSKLVTICFSGLWAMAYPPESQPGHNGRRSAPIDPPVWNSFLSKFDHSAANRILLQSGCVTAFFKLNL